MIEFLSCKKAGESGALDIKSAIEVLNGTVNLASIQMSLIYLSNCYHVFPINFFPKKYSFILTCVGSVKIWAKEKDCMFLKRYFEYKW